MSASLDGTAEQFGSSLQMLGKGERLRDASSVMGQHHVKSIKGVWVSSLNHSSVQLNTCLGAANGFASSLLEI